MGDEKRVASQKVFDVAKPGKTAAAPNSKEVIITNRPMMGDPMMAEKSADANQTGEINTGATTTALRGAEGVSVARSESAVDDTAATEAASQEATSSISKFSTSADEAQNTTNSDDKESSASTSPDKVDELKKAEIDAREAAEHDKKIQQLVAGHKYYLPINQIEKQRNARTAVIGVVVVLVLAAAWLDVSLDAGIINIPGVHALTHFF